MSVLGPPSLAAGIVTTLLGLTWTSVCCANQGEIDFNRDIRPILSNHCFACHGPDAEHREAGLRLDDADAALAKLESGDVAIVPGKPDESTLIDRIDSPDESDIMPPPDFNKPLTNQQRDLLRRWVAQGAAFSAHWSLVAPKKNDPPTIEPELESTVQGPIDRFITDRAHRAGLKINPSASRRSLIRRATLDLTGLPPTVDEIHRFLADQSPSAYEKLLDRLLQSKRFGEHQARHWLDLVRYGDTHGLHLDNYREMWPYRDWVINALNSDMPLDQFYTEQLAGDLLPDASLDQQIASGFNRLNVTTNEGGSIYDEVFMRNCVDRVSAFGTVFLGMTTECVACHDHKFDPLTMGDFYSLVAYFNSLDGRAMDGNRKDHEPTVQVPTREGLDQIESLRKEIVELEAQMDGPLESAERSQRRWESQWGQDGAQDNAQAGANDSAQDGVQVQWHRLQPEVFETESTLKLEKRDDGTIVASGEVADKDTVTIVAPVPSGGPWQLLRLDVIGDDETKPAGLSSNGNAVLTEIQCEQNSSSDPERWVPVKLLSAEADYEQSDGPFAVANAIDGKLDADSGWAIGGHLNPGARWAYFVASDYFDDSESTKLRVKLHFKSKYTKHQFKQVRLSVSNTVPRPPAEQQIVADPWYQVGPFPLDSTDQGYQQSFASEGRPFKADEKFSLGDQQLAWTVKPQYLSTQVNSLAGQEQAADKRAEVDKNAEVDKSAAANASDPANVVVLHRTIHSPSVQKATLLLGVQDGYVLYFNNQRIGSLEGRRSIVPLIDEFDVNLKKGENHLLLKIINHGGDPGKFAFAMRSPAAAVPDEIATIVKIQADKRSQQQRDTIRWYYRHVVCIDPPLVELRTQKNKLVQQIGALRKAFPTTLVWRELATPRPSHIMLRGQYDQKGDEVPRAVPSAFPPLPQGAPNDRLGLAQWLTDPSHPLTARVSVNRFWQQLFGTGLVKTSEDFGAQGAPPSHRELLDWLAVDFQQSGWNVKRFFKQVMMSQTYRRDQTVSPEQLRIDPHNRLLARGARFRLDAEVLRDQALFASGLLVEKLGGPSVKPPQPEGLWKAVGYSGSNTVRFKADSGDKIYRRSVYTFWKRTSAPPVMALMDAPSRESCTARRERTNTPLQALMMLNEQQYVECAKNLAQRALLESADDDGKRIEWIFESLTSRLPNPGEVSELSHLLGNARDAFAQSPDHAKELLAMGDSKVNPTVPPLELAAWTILASTVLNLDEVVSK